MCRSASKLSGMRGHQLAEDCRRLHGRCHFQVLGKRRAEPVLVAFRLVQALQEVKPLEYFFLPFSIQED